MSDHPKVAIFWDYENCSPPSNSSGLGFDIVNNIGRIARLFGSVTTFRAYLDISAQSSKSVLLRSELQSSGVSMIDCPHNGKKDVVDKMMLVDMLAFAVDHPTPATIMLITGDRDYAYAVSILKLRKYHVILVVPSTPHTPPSLENQASLVIDWGTVILRSRTESLSTQSVRQQTFVDLDSTLVSKILKELQGSPRDDSEASLYSTPSQGASMRRVTARDLLEPSNYDLSQDSNRNPFSPGNSTSTGSDTALPIPKTPSRSRHTSVSTGSTWTGNAAIVTPCPPGAEQSIPAKNPLSTTAGRSSTPDATDVSNRANRSLSVLTSIDALELPLHDDRPPSSIIIRSPLAPGSSTRAMPGVLGEPSPPCSHESDCLASPFVTAMGQKVLQPFANRTSHTMIKPSSPAVAPTRTLVETMCETPHMKHIAVSMELDALRGLRFENTTEKSMPHSIRLDDACNAPDLVNSNQASVATHSPSSRNVGLPVPASEHASLPAAGLLGVSDGVDSAQLPAFPRASNQDRVTPSSVSASSSSTPPITKTSSRDETELLFEPLVHLLIAARARGVIRPLRTKIAVGLDIHVYQRAGVSKFKDYAALAERKGIIELGGKYDGAWIALHPNWFEKDGNTQFRSISASPTFDSTTVTQGPLLTASDAVIERAEIAPFRLLSPKASDGWPTSPPLQYDGASRSSTLAPFQPLIDILAQMRDEGCNQPRRSLLGQKFSKAVYSQASVADFKEYIHKAADAQVVELGGTGGFAWIQLHPELKC